MGKSGGIFLIGQDTSIDEFVIHVQGELQYSKTINKKSDEDDSAKTQETHLYIRNISDKFIPNENLALLLTTSGSTGSPKLVKISNKNLVSNAISISKYLDISENDRAITSLPFNYSYGLSVINSHLYSGGSIVLTNKSIMEGGFWDAVRNNSVTSFSGVPYSYEILLKLKIEKLDAPSIKKMTQAGGKLDSEKIEKIYTACRDNSIKFYTMYGQTEATARISYLPTEDTLRKPNSIGIAIPDGQLWLENKNGDIVKKAGVIGELVYQGANVSMGYAKNINDLTSGDVNCGVLKTGDLASFDEEGYFYIEGRKNRFIKVYGIRVSLDSLEKMVSKMGYTCAATGVDNKLLLYVVANLSDLSSEQLRMDIAGVLRINIIAIYINLVKELPRLETGKVDYNLLS